MNQLPEPKSVVAKIQGLFPRLRLIWSDGGYDGQDFIQWVLGSINQDMTLMTFDQFGPVISEFPVFGSR